MKQVKEVTRESILEEIDMRLDMMEGRGIRLRDCRITVAYDVMDELLKVRSFWEKLFGVIRCRGVKIGVSEDIRYGFALIEVVDGAGNSLEGGYLMLGINGLFLHDLNV